MKSALMIVCIIPLVFSCGKTEEKFLFSKDSQDYNAANAVLAARCKTENASLVTRLNNASEFSNLFAAGQTERIFKFERTRTYTETSSLTEEKSAKAGLPLLQYVRIIKPSVSGGDMTVIFSSSGSIDWGDEQKSKTFTISEAFSEDIKDEILNGVCNSSSESYSGSISASKTQVKFSDTRTITKVVDNTDQIQKQVKETFILDSGLPLFFYRYNGSVEKTDRVSASATTKTSYSTPKIVEITSTNTSTNTLNLARCSAETVDSAEGIDYTGCSDVRLNSGLESCTFNLTSSHSGNTDPETYLTFFSGCTP